MVCLHLRLGPLAQLLAWWRRATLATVLVGIECWRPLRRLERVAFERAGRLLAISQHTVRRFREANPDLAWRDVTVCHLATPALEESIDHEARAAAGGFALIVGRMASSERYKGHDLLIDIWPRLLAEIPDARLVVAGAGDDLPRLEARAAPLGAAIRFEGRVTETGLDALYRDCAFFVMPSSEEGFGLVFLEAMRAGRACVGATGAASELIEDGATGYLVDPADPESVLKSLLRLFQDPALARRMGEAGRIRWERDFTQRAFSARFLATLGEPSR